MPLAGSAVRAEGPLASGGDYPGPSTANFTRLEFSKLAAWANAPQVLRAGERVDGRQN